MNHYGLKTREVRAAAIGLLALVLLFAPNYGTAQNVRLTRKPAASGANRPTQVATHETLTAKSLGGAALQYRVLLPADYESSPRRYPVLYLLHGAGGDENDWSSRTDLASYIAKFNLIVVMPAVGNTWYANSASDEKARYEDVIIRDLIPHIDAKYRTIGNWHGRAIAGLSMGGFGAMKFALRYPHLFVFAASFSGAFDAPRTDVVVNATDERSKNLLQTFGENGSETRRQNDVFQLLAKISPGTRVPYLYIATGNNDPLVSVLPSNPRFADALRERKFAYEYHERPGSHDWRFWDAEIKSALERMAVFVSHMTKD
jgi:S-formylglutathione hydrolase FrmB